MLDEPRSGRSSAPIGVAAVVTTVVVFAAGAYLLFGRPRADAQVLTRSGDLGMLVRSFVATMPHPDSGGYDQPTPTEESQMANAFRAILDGRLEDAAAMAAPLRYAVVQFTDDATGRSLAILQEIRNPDGSWPHGWGLYVVEPSSRSPLMVEVAHPLDDIDTPLVGVATFRLADARALLVAGASRFADDGDIADVAHDSFSVFEAVHEAALTPGSIVFEPHGFETSDHLTYGDAVVSSGAAPPDHTAVAVADALAMDGFDVCLYDGASCSLLGGTTNVQGASTRALGASFLHIEMAIRVRASAASRQLVARAVAQATA